MKILILVVIAGLWAALFLSGSGMFVYSETIVQADGAKFLRCHYVKATAITKRDIALAGRISATCPKRL